MSPVAIARQRLANQRLTGPRFAEPADVVRHQVAVQAQDYRGGLWGVGIRTEGATEEAVERAIEERAIVRTWPMRGTLHLVAAADVRWMLLLLAPRIVGRAAGRLRQLGLAASDLTRARKLLVKALRGGGRLTRAEAYALLAAAGMSPEGQRGIHVLWHLAQEGVICHGPRRGKQPTFVLLDEWLPSSKPRPREEAIAELAQRYFESHGPATVADFSWWSGLPAADGKAGLAAVKDRLAVQVWDGQDYWGPARPAYDARSLPGAHLLPPFDELLVAYRDRSASADAAHAKDAFSLLSPALVVRGTVIGTWTRAADGDGVRIAPRWFGPPTAPALRALRAAAARYARFLGQKARMVTDR